MNNIINDKLIAVIRIRGRVNVKSDIKETMNRLNLKYVNNCRVIKATDSYFGMLKKCESYVAYGEINNENLTSLFAKNSIDIDPKEVFDNKYNINELKTVFKLHPPKHGFKSTKLSFKQGGSLGYMGNEINQLLKRMV
ncbi:MAG: uL30 family ribosomal protein [Candidatus Marsarchaeota archaeon]|nr:uL30 family ribosomal protein [Candidatus Marsarchaeota archaeon]MCL5094635.1 uL30 family ribosomal protein [Candidatus Marsarchaeota archaeon]